jgi:hypothetical protein
LANERANGLTVAQIAHRCDVMTIESYGVEGAGIHAKTASIAAFAQYMHDSGVLVTLNRTGRADLLAWRVAAMPAEMHGERASWFVATDPHTRVGQTKPILFEK